MHLPKMPNPFGFLGHWNDAKIALVSLLGPIDPNGSTSFYNPRLFAMILMIMAIKALIILHRISCHLVHQFEEQLVFILLQNLL